MIYRFWIGLENGDEPDQSTQMFHETFSCWQIFHGTTGNHCKSSFSSRLHNAGSFRSPFCAMALDETQNGSTK
jgi:hypothetical protein